MAPQHGGGPSRGPGRGSSSSRGGGRHGQRGGGSARARVSAPSKSFRSTRLDQSKDHLGSPSQNEPSDTEDTSIHQEPEEQETVSSSEDEHLATKSSYSSLLESLNAHQGPITPVHKKRKLQDDLVGVGIVASGDIGKYAQMTSAVVDAAKAKGNDSLPEEENLENDMGSNLEDSSAGEDGDEEEKDFLDPFAAHFNNMNEEYLSSRITAFTEKRWSSSTSKIDGGITRTASGPFDTKYAYHPIQSMKDISLKRRLFTGASNAWERFNGLEKDLLSPLLAYHDTFFGVRTLHNASRIRDMLALHSLNHIFKTRDRVIKNNTRLSQHEGESLDLRDQGFTRPKVLYILPTRQSCVKVTNSIISLCESEQQENKARFMESFAADDDKTWDDKPEDFRDLFGGNDDDMFRIGLKFTRKTVKYFSAFYNSDIILASPLGLRTALETGSGRDKEKGPDADFLSSIEIVVIDHANALLMQNWQHVEYIFSQLNLLPKESHGCDFSRVRSWYLDGKAKYLRQTVVLSDYITPEINGLASTYMQNVTGKVKYIALWDGAMLDLPALPVNITQTFSRFDSPTPISDPESRFQYFRSAILPSLLRDKHFKGTLIFIPSYLDFVRLRNHLSTSTDTVSLSFGGITEYTSVRDVARARSHFMSGRHSILLYTERAHHFRRYRLRGVKRVVFYGLPENPIFWSEVVQFLGHGPEVVQTKYQKGMVRAMFSKWDVLKLERVVGTSRVAKMVGDKGGDTFDFV